MQTNRIAAQSSTDPRQFAKWVESNLTNFAEHARREMEPGDSARNDGLLIAGIAFLRAREQVRQGLREIERNQWRQVA